MKDSEIKFERPRPTFPKRAVVTTGMPYGNKTLHFGHVGMALRGDFFARFLRDRIGKDNVIFVSGTDCYGSTSVESFRKLKEEGALDDCATVKDFVEKNHNLQAKTFADFEIGFNLFGGSALGRAGEIHKDMSAWFLNTLTKAGMISKHSSWQFFDKKHNCLLNGRQVVGKCPVEGCLSDHGYADECSLGHQYLPQDLIDPISTLSGEKPTLIKVENLYFNLEDCIPELKAWIEEISHDGDTPPFMVKEINEFFKHPMIYIKRQYFDMFNAIKNTLPPHTELDRDEKAPSMAIVFEKLTDREKACEILASHDIHYRTGKTLTPFRLTCDIDWGVPCPESAGVKNQTFYVWPESLWAPITFTKTYLESQHKPADEWKKFWCDKDAKVYQFLGEDNLYFYGPAQQAMFLYMQGSKPVLHPENGQLQLTKICPIKSILYMNSKASSSGSLKPPAASEFLKYYTSDQFRIHFMAMNLTNNNVSLSPKAFNPDAKDGDPDPMVLEGNLLTNVYNRILRTVFYSTQNNFGGVIPKCEIDDEVISTCKNAILNYERFMADKKFHQVYNCVDVFIRNINKYWVKGVNNADENALKKLTANTLQMIVTADILLHPIVPKSSENVADYIGLDLNKCFDWENIFKPFYQVLNDARGGKLTTLKEKEDFFRRSNWQLEEFLRLNTQEN